MEPLLPRVRVVVLNFDGGDMTMDCLRSLQATDWPSDRLETVLVDNGSLDDVVARVPVEFPDVRVIEPLRNTGFAGGCNLGIEAPGEWDFVALVNNDATVEPGWLRALWAAFDAPDVAAVNAKLLLADRYHGVEVTLQGNDPLPERGGRPVGVRLTGLRLDGQRVDDRVSFDEGFHPPDLPKREAGEEFARWSTRSGSVRIAAGPGDGPQRVSLRLSAPEPCRVTLTTDDADLVVDVGGEPGWFDVPLPPGTFDVINNAGSELYSGGYGGDRGFLYRDRGQFEQRAEVFAWCGAAVLLRREYLDAVGHFDERLFLYYEDTDLSWRGRLAGWRYVYEPGAVVRHRHSASSGEHSPVFIYHTQRNRLLVILKLAPISEVLRVFAAEAARFIRGALADIPWRMVRLHPPALGNTRQRVRIYRGVASLAAAMLRDRRAMRCSVSRAELVRRWEVTK